jgi:CDP-glucose 4,6-dehydratase
MNTFWKSKNVAVTGATGMVGSWLVKRLIKEGALISALIYHEDYNSELIRSGDIHQIVCIRGDLRNIKSVDKLLKANNAEIVFHLGAQTIVGDALVNPLVTFDSNIRGTWNLMESVRLNSDKIKSVVVASSDKAYGTSKFLPYDEDTPLMGEGPYDVSKSCTDLIAQSYFKTYGVPVVIARCGNIYGGGDLNWSRIVPGTVKSLLEGNTPEIRSNGKYLRDYIYVEDVVDAYMSMAKSAFEGKTHGEAFNFSREEPINVLDIYSEICVATIGNYVTPTIMDCAPHEIVDQHLSSKKARETIGWESRYTLSESLNTTVEWYKKYIFTKS